MAETPPGPSSETAEVYPYLREYLSFLDRRSNAPLPEAETEPVEPHPDAGVDEGLAGAGSAAPEALAPASPVDEGSLPPAVEDDDRGGIDDLLSTLEQGLKAVLSERNEVRALVAQLEQEIAGGSEREASIREALAAVARIRAQSERRRKADLTLRAAEAQAEKILEDARSKALDMEQELQRARQLAVEAQARLTSLFESSLAEVPPSRTELREGDTAG